MKKAKAYWGLSGQEREIYIYRQILVFKATVQAVRRRPVTTRPQFDPRPVHAKFVVSTVALFQASLPVHRPHAVSAVPPTPQTLHLTITLFRKANCWCLGTFTQKKCYAQYRGVPGTYVVLSHWLLVSVSQNKAGKNRGHWPIVCLTVPAQNLSNKRRTL